MWTSLSSTSISYTRPSSTKSSPSSGSMTLASASSTSSTDGMAAILVASSRASRAPPAAVHRGPDPGALGHPPGGGRYRRPAHDPAPGRRLDPGLASPEVTGPSRLAPVQRGDRGGADAAPRGDR